jgi:hypothetical protein
VTRATGHGEAPATRWFLVTAIYVAIALGFAWPLVRVFGSAWPSDAGDPALLSYIMWWNAHTLPLTEQWWNVPIFFPERGVLALSETFLGVAPFSSPLIWIGLSPVVVHNVLFLASSVTAALGAFALTRFLTGRSDAAFVAGIAFGFCPYRVLQTPHLQLLITCWMPFALLAAHRYLRDRHRRDLVFLGVCWTLNGLTSGYYLVYFGVFLGMWLLWFVRDRQAWAALTATLVAASLPLAPVLLGYARIQSAFGAMRSPGEIADWGADLVAFAAVSIDAWVPSAWLREPTPEAGLYPGLVVVTLAFLGVWRVFRRPGQTRPSSRSVAAFYVFAAVLTALLSMGPVIKVAGETFATGPYAWLMSLPGGSTLRVPPRFAMLTALALAVAAGIGWSTLRVRRLHVLTLTLVAVATGVDGWSPRMPLGRAPAPVSMPGFSADTAVLELPIRGFWDNGEAVARAASHGRPVVNGISGYNPPYYHIIQDEIRRGDESVLVALRQVAPLAVLIDRNDDSNGSYDAFVRRQEGATLAYGVVPGQVYRLPKIAAPVRFGDRLPIKSIQANVIEGVGELLTDGNVATSWRTPRPQRAGDAVVITLDRPARITRVEIDSGKDAREYVRRLRIDAREPGGRIVTVWDGGAAGPVLLALLQRSPATTAMYDFNATLVADQVTLTATIDNPERAWAIADLRVFGTPK